ncbi:MAG: S9 family peptidase [Candidatus Kapaibacterium sp.]
MLRPPKPQKISKTLEIHGHKRTDDYYWLREKDNPEVIKHLKEENEYTEKFLRPVIKIRRDLYNEITGRIKEDDSSAPYRYKGYYYYHRFEPGQEYPLYCRKKGSLDAKEEIMLNVNKFARGHEYYNITGLRISPDNNILAFGEDKVGRRLYTIRFLDLETGEFLNDELTNTTGSAAWSNNGNYVFYTVKDESLRPYKIFRHKLGAAPADDEEIYHEADSTFLTHCWKDKSEKYIMIGSHATLSDEYRFLEADNPEGEIKILQERERGLEYSAKFYNGDFYIITNLDAKNFRLMKAPTANPAKENWLDIIPHRQEVLLEEIEIFSNFFALQERKNGLNMLRIITWDGETDKYLKFDDPAYLAYIGTNPEYDTTKFRYGYSSMTTPSTVYEYDTETGETVLLKRQEIPGGFDPSEYESIRIYVPARDGASIPVSLVYKKKMKRDEGNPLLLYGYGSYGISIDPSFSISAISLLDRGFIYAIAHVRGGQELGRKWYEEGRQLNKKNTFYDFIDAGKYLKEKGLARDGKIFAMGGSAGGLLMGAVANMEPGLFKGIVAAVPFVDVITTMLDESIPLTTGEYDEWGNPNEKQYYDYILSYSPYDNVEQKKYPAILITTGLHDSQVQYWEPAKWAAKLRENNTGDTPVLLYTDMGTGHSGPSGRYKRYKLIALEYSFILMVNHSLNHE